jgi:hypothetical protein
MMETFAKNVNEFGMDATLSRCSRRVYMHESTKNFTLAALFFWRFPQALTRAT